MDSYLANLLNAAIPLDEEFLTIASLDLVFRTRAAFQSTIEPSDLATLLKGTENDRRKLLDSIRALVVEKVLQTYFPKSSPAHAARNLPNGDSGGKGDEAEGGITLPWGLISKQLEKITDGCFRFWSKEGGLGHYEAYVSVRTKLGRLAKWIRRKPPEKILQEEKTWLLNEAKDANEYGHSVDSSTLLSDKKKEEVKDFYGMKEFMLKVRAKQVDKKLANQKKKPAEREKELEELIED